jgi:Recombinase zinc beta ribbon domain
MRYCERCGARMHGTRGSKTAIRRYMCSTRRYGHACGERIVKAHDLEAQLIDWIADFQPQGQLLDLLLQTLIAADTQHEQPAGERRRELLDQLKRPQDLYVLGDLTKAQYVMRRQALEEGSNASVHQPTLPPTAPKHCSNASPASGSWRPTRPSDASSCSPCSPRSGRKTAASSGPTPRPLPAVLPGRTTSQRSRHRRRVVPKAGATGVEAAFVASGIEIRF